MKKFDALKVSKIAFDKDLHQQIYVKDNENRDLLIKTLIDMGFQTDEDSISMAYAHLPFAINTNENMVFSVGAVSMIACALHCGARVLSYREMNDLII
jgi:hypothetical protein